MKNLVLGLSLLLLAACSSPTEVSVIDTKVDANRPTPPAPVSIYNDIYWYVIDGKVCLSSPDGVKLNTQTKELTQYIKELQKLVCYYEDDYEFCE